MNNDVRIVIETNVRLSGLLWKGTPHTLLATGTFWCYRADDCHTLFEELAEGSYVPNLPEFSSTPLAHINRF